jgi:hypothetical protein
MAFFARPVLVCCFSKTGDIFMRKYTYSLHGICFGKTGFVRDVFEILYIH